MTPPSLSPCLGVSGSSGTGKSTLARSLAARLDVPYLEEGMRRRLEAGLDLHALSHGQHRALLCALLDEMRESAEAARRAHGGFVCDRSPLDMAAFWLYYRFAFDLDATARFMEAVDAALEGFELVVVLPRGAIPLEDDGVRSANPWVQLHFDALLEAMLPRARGVVRLLRLPGTLVCADARTSTVLAAVRGAAAEGGGAAG